MLCANPFYQNSLLNVFNNLRITYSCDCNLYTVNNTAVLITLM